LRPDPCPSLFPYTTLFRSRVQHVRPVGGRDDDDVSVGVEAVHLDQQLVEGLLALVVTAAEAGATLAADRVDLVHEHDAGRVLLGDRKSTRLNSSHLGISYA